MKIVLPMKLTTFLTVKWKKLLYIKDRISKIKDNNQAEKTINITPADEILKYKKLLDIGAITSDEYNAKKKQLLNL